MTEAQGGAAIQLSRDRPEPHLHPSAFPHPRWAAGVPAEGPGALLGPEEQESPHPFSSTPGSYETGTEMPKS